MYEDYIGKKVVARSVEAGVYYGTLVAVEGAACKLEDVRNIWAWQGATCLSQVALDGIKDGKVGPSVGSMVLTSVCQLIPLADAAIDNLSSQPVWRV